jgi:group I intron endonuclease
MNGVIYKITSPSGRVYIGQTKDYKKRVEAYRHLRCKSQTKLYNSLKKYGFYNHSFDILEHVGDECSLLEKEKNYIKTLNCINSGLNIALGGNRSPNAGKHLSDEHKRKISESNKGKIISNKQRERHRLAMTGRISPRKGIQLSLEQKRIFKEKINANRIKYTPHNKGIAMSQETKNRISKTKKGVSVMGNYGKTEEHKRKISNSLIGNVPWNKGKTGVQKAHNRCMVIRSDGEVFHSMQAAAKVLGYRSHVTILNSIKNDKEIKGYKFKKES